MDWNPLEQEAQQWMADIRRTWTGYTPLRPTSQPEYYGSKIPAHLETTVLRLEQKNRVMQAEQFHVQRDLFDTQQDLPLKERIIRNADKLLEETYAEYGVPSRDYMDKLKSIQNVQEHTALRERSRGF